MQSTRRVMLIVTLVTALMELTGLSAPAFALVQSANPCVPLIAEGTPEPGGHDQGALMDDTASSPMPMPEVPLATPGASPAVAIPPIDLAFIDLMGPHHEGAILMSQVALSRAEHDEIRTLAQSIIDSQGAEQRQLAEWRDAWFAGASSPTQAGSMAAFDQVMAELGIPANAGGMEPMGGSMDVAALCAAEQPFDLAFIDLMIPHHQSAIDMANAEVVAGSQPELVAFAGQVIEVQTSEIARMQAWRDAWYGATPSARLAT